MRRPTPRLAAIALGALLALGLAACSGSEGSDDDRATTTTAGVTTGTGDPALGRLSDLDGTLDGRSGDELDCYQVGLAYVALSLQPTAVLTGAGSEGLQQAEADLATLRSRVPAEIAGDFDTYASGVQAFAAALEGVDLSDLENPATRQRVIAAGEALESPEVTEAQAAIEAYFARTCPSSGATTTTAG